MKRSRCHVPRMRISPECWLLPTCFLSLQTFRAAGRNLLASTRRFDDGSLHEATCCRLCLTLAQQLERTCG